MTLRQSNEPGNPVEGMLWVDTSGNNVERKQWTGSTWELDVAVGPDAPEHAVQGARWSKTDENTVLVYDGSTWNSIGVTDHANLSNINASDHHTRYSDSEAKSAVSASDVSATVSSGSVTVGGSAGIHGSPSEPVTVYMYPSGSTGGNWNIHWTLRNNNNGVFLNNDFADSVTVSYEVVARR